MSQEDQKKPFSDYLHRKTAIIKFTFLLLAIGQGLILASTYYLQHESIQFRKVNYNDPDYDVAKMKYWEAEELVNHILFTGKIISLIGFFFLLNAAIDIIRNSELSANVRLGFLVLIAIVLYIIVSMTTALWLII